MLVAPRVGAGLNGRALNGLVQELAERFGADPKRVLMVGHSMGAAAGVGAAATMEPRPRALAALGGGGRVSDLEALARTRCFVGVGTRDFAVNGARSLARTLKQGNRIAVEFREYPEVEHLAVVQVALEDVFAQFEQALKE
jgi:acetyl esterase/lipase